ncbi:MAG: DUF2235 domain-containing protein [Victivallaceae bacterium]|nr:DUF2235 domain-containing protein [Victivallaceae bacterium]
MAAIFANVIMTYGIPKTAPRASVDSLQLNKNIDAYKAPTIRFLGLFDPVAGPSGMRAPSSIPSNVQKTAIAYAWDEKRKAFKQSFFSGSYIKDKFFPGCHSDIGGGYKQSGLSYNVMRWMVGQGGYPFRMPSMGNYRMTSETVRHQETQWYWAVTDIILSPFL